MSITRRDAIKISGSTLAGLSLTGLTPDELVPQAAPAQEFPQTLVESQVRDWADLPLNPDGSAPVHPESAAGPIRGRLMWRAGEGRAAGVTPPGETDYTKMRIRVDPRGNARLRGTMTYADLEKLPRFSQTTLLQCGTPEPTGVVKWTGVRFSDFANMIGLSNEGHYARFIATDRHYVDEPVHVLKHPAGDARVDDERPAALPGPRRAAPADHPVPLRQPEHQGHHGHPLRHAEPSGLAGLSERSGRQIRACGSPTAVAGAAAVALLWTGNAPQELVAGRSLLANGGRRSGNRQHGSWRAAQSAQWIAAANRAVTCACWPRPK